MKFHIAKLNMMKHQAQNIPMKIIQETQKQTKLPQFLTLCVEYQTMKSQKVKITQIPSKGKSLMWSIRGLKVM